MSQPILSNYDSTRRATSTRKWEFSSRHKGPGQFLTDPGLPGLVFVTVQVVSQDEVVKLACRVQPALREMNQDRIESVTVCGVQEVGPAWRNVCSCCLDVSEYG